MLRRTGCCLALFSSAGGSAPRSKRPHSSSGTDASASAAAAAASGVYLPWTARPWAVTYRVHYSQWKFVDTVFAHLATVTPAVLNDRAEEQGVRDVLCELEEPAVALRRQQARQARQLKKQEKASAASAISSPSQLLACTLQHTATTAQASPSGAAPSDMAADDAAAAETSCTLESLASGADVPATHEVVDSSTTLLDVSKMKGSRKSKRASRKSATSAVVIYELIANTRARHTMTQCFKCKQAIGTVVSRDGPAKLYCPDCFLAYCAGAVRENAFQQCLVPSDTPLAVAVSGGPNSMMLLRELGQLRYKTQDRIRRQQLMPQRQAPAQGGKSCSTSASSPPARSTPLASSLILLPFHLCEDELVLPPPLSSSSPSPSSLHAMSGRHEAINQVRSTMEEQFATLRKYVQQQPPRWVYHGEVPCGHKKSKKKKDLTVAVRTGAARAGGANVATPEPSHGGGDGGSGSTAAPSPQPLQQHDAEASGEASAATACLFDDSEMRLFRYSDVLSGPYLSELRYALHASRLSLSDREALYARVRQHTLCRAAQRVCQEHRQRKVAAAAAAGVVGGVAHEEGICEDEAHRSEEELFDDHVSLEGANSKTKSHLLLGSNAARCATAALEALVTGAGGEGVVHGAGFRGFTHEVVCLRPLRTMLPKETIMYTRLCGIACSYTPALCTGTATRSVHRTLEQFVLTMMTSYRTMIFNVLNTVQRLEVHPAALQELVRGTDNAPASQTHVHGEGSAEAGCAQSAGKTTRKALPARTAQQNRDDLRLVAPLHVHRDMRDVSSTEADIDSAVAMCCVCGCTASIGSCYCGQNAHPAARQLEMVALSTTSAMTLRTSGPSSSTVADAASASEASPTTAGHFVCYACQGLVDAWPPSVFGKDSTTEKDEPSNDSTTAAGAASCHGAIASTAAVFRLCTLFT